MISTYRTRQNTTSTPITGSLQVSTWTPAGTTVVTIGSSSVGSSCTKMIADWVTKKYRYYSGKGLIINNSLVQTQYINSETLVNVNHVVTSYFHRKVEGVPTTVPGKIVTTSGTVTLNRLFSGTPSWAPTCDTPEPLDVQRVVTLAVMKAWANISSTDLLLGAAIAESKKTTRDLLTTARKIIKVGKFLRKPTFTKMKSFQQKVKVSKKVLNEAEQAYMNARYNLRPLYYDMLGAMKLTVKPYPTPRQTYRGYSEDSTSETATHIKRSFLLPGVEISVTKVRSNSLNVRAGVLCAVKDKTIWKRMGVSLIPQTVWELTPFSFILDWFANTGDVISAYSPKYGVDVLTSWATRVQDIAQTTSIAVDSIDVMQPSPYAFNRLSHHEYSCSLSPAYVSSNTITKVRVPNPSRSYIPQKDVNLSVFKSLDLAIIGKNLSSLFRSLK